MLEKASVTGWVYLEEGLAVQALFVIVVVPSVDVGAVDLSQTLPAPTASGKLNICSHHMLINKLKFDVLQPRGKKIVSESCQGNFSMNPEGIYDVYNCISVV